MTLGDAFFLYIHAREKLEVNIVTDLSLCVMRHWRL